MYMGRLLTRRKGFISNLYNTYRPLRILANVNNISLQIKDLKKHQPPQIKEYEERLILQRRYSIDFALIYEQVQGDTNVVDEALTAFND